jgi:hypothetical protein
MRLTKSLVLFLVLFYFFPRHCLAYLGPGVGLSAIGAFLAFIAGGIVVIVGLIWYPIRQIIRRWRKPADNKNKGVNQ